MDISEKDRRLRQKLGAALALLFFIASVFTVTTWYSQIADALHSNGWPAVSGVVIESELDISVNAGESDSVYPVISYVYQVTGQTYEARKLQFVQDGFGMSWAKSKLASYPVDAVVEVSYNPADPQIAVLEPGGQPKWYLFVSAVALAFLSVFAGLAWLCFQDCRKMSRMASNESWHLR